MVDNILNIERDFFIGKTQHAKSVLTEDVFPPPVVLLPYRVIVHIAVNFNGQIDLWCIEIENELFERMLSSKFHSLDCFAP